MEERKSIIGYEWLYEIGNFWNVKSLCKLVKHWNHYSKRKERILKLDKSRSYYSIQLQKDWINNSYSIHRLVAEAFISNPDNKPQVNHKDWNKLNNNVENLERCTSSENQKHSINVLWNIPYFNIILNLDF